MQVKISEKSVASVTQLKVVMTVRCIEGCNCNRVKGPESKSLNQNGLCV